MHPILEVGRGINDPKDHLAVLKCTSGSVEPDIEPGLGQDVSGLCNAFSPSSLRITGRVAIPAMICTHNICIDLQRTRERCIILQECPKLLGFP